MNAIPKLHLKELSKHTFQYSPRKIKFEIFTTKSTKLARQKYISAFIYDWGSINFLDNLCCLNNFYNSYVLICKTIPWICVRINDWLKYVYNYIFRLSLKLDRQLAGQFSKVIDPFWKVQLQRKCFSFFFFNYK